MVANISRTFNERPALAWLLAILVGGAIHLAIWPFSEPPVLFSDFKKAYWVAAVHLWNGGLDATYPFTIHGNWSNLPVLAWPFAVLVPLGQDVAVWVYLAIGICITTAAWWLLAKVAGLRGPMVALLLFLFLLNGPLLNSLREGNSTHFVLFFLIAGVALWQMQRGYLAGLAFGMAAAIKPALLLVGIYFFVRRRWSVVMGGGTTLAIAIALSFAIFGVDAHIQWFNEVIAFNMGKATPAFNVQSLDGMLIRIHVGATELFYWGPVEPPRLHKIVRYGLVGIFFLSFVWYLWRSERKDLTSPRGTVRPGPHDFMQLSIVLIFALVISPLTWTHYYCYLLLPLGLYLGGQLPLPKDATTRWLFWPGYLLTSLPVIVPALELKPDPPQELYVELFAMTVVSAWVIGALLMLACFFRGAFEAIGGHADDRPRHSTADTQHAQMAG